MDKFIDQVANTHPASMPIAQKIIEKEIKPELVNYIAENIFPEYQQNEQAHDLGHIKYVINRSLTFAHKNSPNLDYAMIYTIASYHDLKHHVSAKEHERLSSKALTEDQNLENFFDTKQIQIMAEAVMDHRSVKKQNPRTIYGKIICSADRTTTVRNAMAATYHYRVLHNPNNNLAEIIKDSYEHIKSKYGPGGYAISKNYFPDPEFEKYLLDITKTVSSFEIFQKIFIKVNNLEKADLAKTITENKFDDKNL